MADGFDVVTVGVEYEGAVVVRMIVGTDSGRAVVATACGDRRLVERIDRSAGAGLERDVVARAARVPAADPQLRPTGRAEAGAFVAAGLLLRHIHDRTEAERGECLHIERT